MSFAVASAMLLIGVSSWTTVRDCLGGRFGATIGALSFPIYLLHVPIILSAGCAAFIAANDRWGTNAASAVLAIVTFAITIPAASVLQIIDARWVGLLNRIVNCLTRRSAPVTIKLPASVKEIC